MAVFGLRHSHARDHTAIPLPGEKIGRFLAQAEEGRIKSGWPRYESGRVDPGANHASVVKGSSGGYEFSCARRSRVNPAASWSAARCAAKDMTG